MARDYHVRIVEQRVGHGLQDVANDLERTTDDTRDFDHAMRDASDTSKDLDRRIKILRQSVQDLGAEYVRTGDKTVDRYLTRDRRQLAKLERIAKEAIPGGGGRSALSAILPGDASGRSGGWGGTGLDFSRGLGESRGIIIAGLVGLAIAASPAIGAAVAGAVTGAVGAGGIIGGVAAAATDARVKDAFSTFVESFSADDFGRQAFVKPTIAALGELRSAFQDMDLGDALEKVAPFVDLFAKGIGDLGRNFMPGFNAAMDRAGPFLAVLGDELGETGAALGEMIKDMAESDGAIEGLMALFDLLEGTLRFIGSASNKLADTWDALTDVGESVADKVATIYEWFDKLANKIPVLGPVLGFAFGTAGDLARNAHGHFEKMNDAVDDSIATAEQARQKWGSLAAAGDSLAESLAAQRDQLVKLSDAWKNHFDIFMGLGEAHQRVQEGLLRLRQGIADNGRDWRINSEAGLENRDLVRSQIQNLENLRQAMITEAGDSVEGQRAANAQYERGIQQLKKLAEQGGLTGQALRDFFKPFEMKIYFTGVLAPGLAELLKLAGRGLAPFTGGWPGWNSGSSGPRPASSPMAAAPTLGQRLGGLRGQWYEGFAAGGTSPAFAPFRVHQGEMLFSNREHYVATAAQVNALGGGSGGTVELVVTGGGGQFEEMLAEMIRRYVRVKGGGNVQATFGRIPR